VGFSGFEKRVSKISLVMGLLSKGKSLSWEDTKKHADHVRKVGIQQLIAHYHRLKDRTNDQLKFGDEVKWLALKSST